VEMDLIVIHGTDDSIVPYENGPLIERLFNDALVDGGGGRKRWFWPTTCLPLLGSLAEGGERRVIGFACGRALG